MSIVEHPEPRGAPMYRQRIVHVAPVPVELAWDLIGGELKLAVVGEVCTYTTRLIGQALSEILDATTATCANVDLTGVTFFDARGVTMLLRARRQARDAGVSLRVEGAADGVVRLLTMCGIDPVLAGDGDSVALDAAQRFDRIAGGMN